MKNLLACSSGGRTSMFQLEWLLKNKRDEFNIVGVFANTGWEHPKTIEFVNNCAVRWKEKFDFELAWVEAVVNEGRVACTHKLVNYETAARNKEPLIEVIKKYGIPNSAYPHCTRELKENPIHDYAENVLGWSNTKKINKNKPLIQLEGRDIVYGKFESYYTALGIRSDEPTRILGEKVIGIFKKNDLNHKKESLMEVRSIFMNRYLNKKEHTEWDKTAISYASEYIYDLLDNGKLVDDDAEYISEFWAGLKNTQNKVYPLVDWHPDKPDKLDILDWWEEQGFDLGLPEHLGNCIGCFRKSQKKTLKVIRDEPDLFYNTMEVDFGHIGLNKIKGEHSDKPRTMYRQYHTSQSLIALFKQTPVEYLKGDEPEHLNEGCASSCEPFAAD